MNNNNKITFATSINFSNLTGEEKKEIDHFLEIITAAKQQILLRKVLYNRNINK